MTIGKTTRVQLELPEKSFERLKKLREITEASSYAEVLRASLRLYEALIEETRAGNTVAIKQADGSEVAYRLVF